MRIESSVVSLSWIPSEAITGLTKLPFEMGVTHYDKPPPDRIRDLDAMQAKGAFRFANELRAWLEVEDGQIVDAGYAAGSGGRMSTTIAKVGPAEVTFRPVPFPLLQTDPKPVGGNAFTFVQTAGGRPGIPAPRPVRRKPFFQLSGPSCWTTLALTIRADGTVTHAVRGASTFPRHWIYDDEGRLVDKIGMIDFKEWYRESFGKRSPWGNFDSPVLATQVESALERELSSAIMRAGTKPKRKKVAKGKTLVRQGDTGQDLFLLLNGVLAVEVDGTKVAELGPGAVLGERALLEGRGRTSTLRAVTDARVAVVGRDQVSTAAMAELARAHKRERRG
ncbi:MAG: hypothetical protein QOJ09_285 [Actinomycetota bacterium]|jgi:hypothetical protein|nr:hypothetical protein [Actinomycetota bacterium]